MGRRTLQQVGDFRVLGVGVALPSRGGAEAAPWLLGQREVFDDDERKMRCVARVKMHERVTETSGALGHRRAHSQACASFVKVGVGIALETRLEWSEPCLGRVVVSCNKNGDRFGPLAVGQVWPDVSACLVTDRKAKCKTLRSSQLEV